MKKKSSTKKKEAVKEKKEVKKETKKSLSYGLLVIIGVVGLIVGLIIGMNLHKTQTINVQGSAEKAVNYINNAILGPQGMSATLKDVKEEDNYIVLTVEINGRTGDLYLLKDGETLFVNKPIIIQDVEEKKELGIPKKDKTNIKFFVMSFCPFGNQAEYGLYPVYQLLKDKVDWEPHYVIYPASMYSGREDQFCMGNYCSMHGIQELHQDVRELCVWKYYDKDTWWKFVIGINDNCSYSNADTCWKSVAQNVGIDINKIEQCVNNEGEELLKKEYELDQQYNVRGSPTVFINDYQYNGARTPQAYKEAICEGFNNEPSECDTNLSSEGGSVNGQC